MAESFTLKVFTPAGLLLEATVASVTVCTSQGEVGILPQHVNYVALLGTGILQYSLASGGQSNKLVVAGGFCSFDHELLTILADAADLPDSVNRTSYGSERADLQKILQTGDSADPKWSLAQQKLARIEALDQLVMH
jgi:F-type H+-transporting ATPase subunit epsilon